MFPHRWQYATFPIPAEWRTAGETQLHLGLGTGLFQWYGPPTYFPSRPLFKAYTHVDPYLDLAQERQGVAPAPAPPLPTVPPAVASKQLAEAVSNAVQHLFEVQVWNWSDVAAGKMPQCLFGAVSQNGFSCPLLPNGTANVSACKKSWQSHDDAGNLPWTTSILAMGQAFASKARWAANFSGQRWVLDRVVGAIDVHVRAQGRLVVTTMPTFVWLCFPTHLCPHCHSPLVCCVCSPSHNHGDGLASHSIRGLTDPPSFISSFIYILVYIHVAR